MKEIALENLEFNPWTKIGKEWFLISCGDEKGYNMMTASWGFMGEMWGKNVIETVVRHNRYTFEFMEKNDLFTVSFLPQDKKEALRFCGAKSGRNCDKAKESGLTPVFSDGTVTFAEAELVFICRKLYSDDFDLDKLSRENRDKWYGTDPVHRRYYGEIIKAYTRG